MDKVKVVELFSGIGAQHKALTNLGIDFEIVGISDWDVNAIISYDAIHTDDGIDYSKDMSKDEILKALKHFTFSTDGKKSCDTSRSQPTHHFRSGGLR
jgi:DNA (cytosine-5)-methyltransferase 1